MLRRMVAKDSIFAYRYAKQYMSHGIISKCEVGFIYLVIESETTPPVIYRTDVTRRVRLNKKTITRSKASATIHFGGHMSYDYC